jgi:hypothetical protein
MLKSPASRGLFHFQPLPRRSTVCGLLARSDLNAATLSGSWPPGATPGRSISQHAGSNPQLAVMPGER